jgi:hypothetical protein
MLWFILFLIGCLCALICAASPVLWLGATVVQGLSPALSTYLQTSTTVV